jgi:hypothetical protein
LLNVSGNKAQVMVIGPDEKAQSRSVELGILGQQGAQILSGVKLGEQVITQGAYGLPDKTKVKVEKPSAEEGEGDAKDKDGGDKKDDDKKDDKGSKDNKDSKDKD